MSKNVVYSKCTKGIVPSVMTDVLKWTSQPDILSFAGGMPDPDLFPLSEITEASVSIAKQYGNKVLQYSTAKGHEGLREFFSNRFKRKGIESSTDSIVPICGVQQGIYFCAKLFLDPGDKVLVTAPTYFGALEVFDAFLPKYLTINLRKEGLDLNELERIFSQEKPKFFYVITNFQNPSGISIPLVQRSKIVELAKKHGVLIIEDDVFGELYFDKPLRSLKSYDSEQVVYLTSLSKTLSAGFRLGFVVPPKALVEKFILLKQLSDVSLNTYVQYIANELCQNGTFDRLLIELRVKYMERRDALLGALEENFRDIAEWTVPDGGMFLWLYLKNKSLDAKRLLESCSKRGLVFLHGAAFFPKGSGGKNELRLSYSNLKPEVIKSGIRSFAKYINDFT